MDVENTIRIDVYDKNEGTESFKYEINLKTWLSGKIFNPPQDSEGRLEVNEPVEITYHYQNEINSRRSRGQKKLTIDGIHFKKSVSINGINELEELKDIFTITNSVFDENLTLLYIKIQALFLSKIQCDSLSISYSQLKICQLSDISYNLNIQNIQCQENFNLIQIQQKQNHSEIKIKDSTFVHTLFTNLNNVNIIGSTFNKKVDLLNHSLENVNFTNSIFEDKISFYGANLTNCDFSRTEFHKKADFRYATLENNTFHWTEFHAQGAFHGVIFTDEPVFHNLILKDTSHLYFENLNPDQGDLSIPKFSLTNTVINGRIDFSENIIDCIDLKDSVIIGILTRRNFNPHCANWETAILLKNEELKQNNIIRALKYKAIEKDLYMKWLEYVTVYFKWSRKCGQTVDLKWKNKIKKLYKKLCKIEKKYQIPENTIIIDENLSIWQIRFDRLSLWLSKIANNHSQSWFRGIIFTFTVWFMCFSMFYIPFPYYNSDCYFFTGIYWKSIGGLLTSGQFFSNMIGYFNPTDYTLLTTYITSSDPEWWVKIFGTGWFLLGKALVPYGIFEVVQAFRKYNKID